MALCFCILYIYVYFLYNAHFDDCIKITDFTTPEVLATQQRFEAILADKPAPLLPIRINFQPESSPLPSTNYEDDIDSGQTFQDYNRRTIGNQFRSGVSFGWSEDHTDVAQDRDRNSNQHLDTFVSFKAQAKWEITLANGAYDVTVHIGDARFSSIHTLNVEGRSYWQAISLNPNEFRQQTQLVSITDGRLTLDAGSAPDFATRLTHLEIIPRAQP